ncbi:hypothetical protein DFH09DRAFT_1086908 [Mycena vulgaris]|nr:hypothetical protein DFH09DRAFT_1086908 [Mycena vulgaris]
MSLPEYGRYLGNKRWAGASEDQTQLKIVRPDIGFPGLSLAVASQDAETERKVPARIAPRPISRPLRFHEAGVPAGRMQDAGAGWLAETYMDRRADEESEGHSEILGLVHAETREGQGRTEYGGNASRQAKTRGRITGRTGKWRARIGKGRDSERETESRHGPTTAWDHAMRGRGLARGWGWTPDERWGMRQGRRKPGKESTRTAHRRSTPTKLNFPAHRPDFRFFPVWAVLPVAACARAIASVSVSAESASETRSRLCGGASIQGLVGHIAIVMAKSGTAGARSSEVEVEDSGDRD